MHIDIEGGLRNLRKLAGNVQHNGKWLSYAEVKAVLMFAKSKGYRSTADIPDAETDEVLRKLNAPSA
jgi:hypothetical protein